MKNYIEIENKYTTQDGDEAVDVWHAVRPTPGGIANERGDLLGHEPWRIESSSVHIYDRSDIDSLRMLLNEIEKEIEKEIAK